MNYISLVWTVARKDLVLELRTLERLIAMGAFAVLIGVLFQFSIDTSLIRVQTIAPSLIWMTTVFAGILGLGRTYIIESENKALAGVLQSPVALDVIYLGKVVSNFILLLLVTTLILVVFSLFFNLSFPIEIKGWLSLVGVFFLGVLCFVSIMTLLSAVAVNNTMGESIIPVLVFPLLVPVMIHAVTATNRIFANRPFVEIEGNLRMLSAMVLIFLMLGANLFRFAIED
ncbi:MAG: heme exporter protein CcmB [Gemmatimonadota bacterium]|nr:heme exporter protein CcmB [Gemmatimonadota bacterium]